MPIEWIDTLLNAEVSAETPGAAVAVLQGAEVLHAAGYGLANLEWHQPVSTQTVFRIASLTKPLTAAAVLRLAELGALRLEDALSDYLPDYPTSGHDLTLYHLLTHTSGIYHYAGYRSNRQDMTPEELTAQFAQQPFGFRPGTRYAYSNSNYVLLGRVIEAVTGRPYGEYLEREVFTPLGMPQTVYLDHERLVAGRASGYERQPDGSYHNAAFISMTQPYAAGALGSTLDDLIRWEQALVSGKLLAPETVTQMFTPARLEGGSPVDYGLGWGIGDYHGHRAALHPGELAGFKSYYARFLQDNLSIIVLANLAEFNAERLVTAIARQLLHLELPVQRPFIIGADALRKCAGVYEMQGARVELAVEAAGRIVLRMGRVIRLIPVSRTAFYAPDEPDIVLHFRDEQDGLFQAATLELPFRVRALRRLV